ncbi:MAG: peptide/nickel transport system ATP-binding protein ddpF [Baekduia sp.]|nr:peptide/nickel transport system ATP-binding protein ddpF [Baekduia sp.]
MRSSTLGRTVALPARDDQAPVASVRDLSVSFGTGEGAVRALRGVSLDIQPGEVIALVGESGSGKSVLGSSLLGLVAGMAGVQLGGTVDVAGVDMLGGSDRVRQALRRQVLGAVFQDPLTSLNPTMRIGHQLTERGISEAHAIQNLADAGVPEPEKRLRQFPHELSGGLRQRVMIAMALGTAVAARVAPAEADDGSALPATIFSDERGTPRLIVADEPTTALDVSVQAQIVLLFDRLRREHGCAVLFVTHDLGVAASIADRIAVLYAGRMCEIGPAADVLLRPTHPYTRALMSARVSVDTSRDEPIVAIKGSPPDPTALPPGCPFAPRCPNARDDCNAALVDLSPRPVADGHGDVACLHPHTDDALGDRAVVSPPTPRRPADPLAEPALVLRGVSKTFQTRGERFGFGHQSLHAVSDVSLTVQAGRVLALVGESGCGKTTTLRMACGLLEPDAGEVVWTKGAARPQLVFQDAGSSLTPWMTVGQLLEEQMGRRGVPRRERKAAALNVLERVGLDARAAGAKPRQLSGGQRQRAGIARALAAEPSLLICDEPVSALDASLAIRVLDLLEGLRDTLGVALLVVTHDLGVARRIADDVAVMYRGEIVEQGPVEDLFTRPAHPYTQGLLAAIPSIEPGRLAPSLAGEPPSPLGEVAGCSFHPRCPYARDACLARDPPLVEVAPERRSACLFADDVLDGTVTMTRGQ